MLVPIESFTKDIHVRKPHPRKDKDSRRFWDKAEELAEFGGLKRPRDTIRNDDNGESDGDESPSELASSARQKEMHGDSEKSPDDNRIVMTQRSYQAEELLKDKLPSWEFNEPMPGWLIKAKEMNQKLKAQTDAQTRYKSALRPLWWRIIDMSDDSFTQLLSHEEFAQFKSIFASSLDLKSTNGSWTALKPAAERCLTSFSKLNEKQLQKIGEMLEGEGIRGAIHEIQKMLQESTNDDEDEADPDLFGDESTPIATKETGHVMSIIEEADSDDHDVRYLMNLLRYTCEMINKKIPQRKNTERDVDIFIKVHIFSCLDQVLDCHYGEMVSRSSRVRQLHALDEEIAGGHKIDWMFTNHDLEKNLPWGLEFSLCERAGSKTDNSRKITSDTIKVQKNLRDMHTGLMEYLGTVGVGLTQPLRRASTKLVMPGFLSTNFQLRVLLLMYVGGDFYAAMELARFDIPTAHKELKEIANVGRFMLGVTKILCRTGHRFKQMKQRAEKDKLSANEITGFQRMEEERTPKKPKNHKDEPHS